ncbi:hypothetical protein CDL15_Pgr021897 [Punica granatum]|nr:hypothetical protein CDL15_Pgr021897 [Punica granatum]
MATAQIQLQASARMGGSSSQTSAMQAYDFRAESVPGMLTEIQGHALRDCICQHVTPNQAGLPHRCRAYHQADRGLRSYSSSQLQVWQ